MRDRLTTFVEVLLTYALQGRWERQAAKEFQVRSEAYKKFLAENGMPTISYISQEDLTRVEAAGVHQPFIDAVRSYKPR